MQAEIVTGKMEASSVMQKTPVETVKSILNRIGVDFAEGLPKETYVTALKDAFCGSSQWILKMIPGNCLEFLLQIWEKPRVEMDMQGWDYLEYLKIFGLAAYQKGNPVSGEPNVIYCIPEMKDQFDFLLKSRKSRALMEQYEQWEKIITGLMYYYGIAEMTALHDSFMRITQRMISYEEFVTFVKCRCSLWPFGVLLRDMNQGNEYYQYVNVENAEMLLMYIRQHSDLPYKYVGKEDLFYISEAAGIDNRWKGVSELGNLLLDELNLNYYRATVLVKTLLLMIQNSCEWEDLKEKMDVLSLPEGEAGDRIYSAVRLLYENVPIYELKGHSRSEYERMFRQKQWKKKKEMFTIINGKKNE